MHELSNEEDGMLTTLATPQLPIQHVTFGHCRQQQPASHVKHLPATKASSDAENLST